MQFATSPTGYLKKITALMLFSVCAMYASAQNGIYEKKLPNGAYGVISYQQSGNSVKAEVFTWWNSANAQTGSYYGEGTLRNGIVTLHSDENEPGCKVTLSLVQGKIKATFANCAIDHLTSDFNGQYTKISEAVAGDYMVTAPKAYFYKKADAASKLKAYVLKGDMVTVDMQNVAANNNTWVFVSYMNKANKETTGFMLLSELKKKD